jgi:hypothetical protein
MSQPSQVPPNLEIIAKKGEKRNDEENLKSFTIRVEKAVINKLMNVGARTGDNKIARVARNYLRLADIFTLDNNRMVGHDGKELALVPVEILRSLIRRAGNDENNQIDLGNEFGKYLKNIFYLDPRNTVTEKMEFIRRLGWFIAKKDPETKQALIPTDFAPDLFIQAMVYQITAKKEMLKPPPNPQKEGKADKGLDKRRAEWVENQKKDQMVIAKNVETEIGFDALTFE